MRITIIGICLFTGLSTVGQEVFDMQKLKTRYPNLKWDSGMAKSFKQRLKSKNSIDVAGTLPLRLLSKNAAPGVYALPLDRMPCLVPDTKDIAVIPNAGLQYKQPVIGRIPNKIKSRRTPITGAANTR